MSLGKYRVRIGRKGLGKFEIREVEPVAGSDFLNVGWIKGTLVSDKRDTLTQKDERGQVVDKHEIGREVSGRTFLMQKSIDEITLLATADEKVHSARYSGMHQANIFHYYAFDVIRITPGFEDERKPGEQLLPLEITSLDRSDALGFDSPLYYLIETAREIRTEQLMLWLAPRMKWNQATTKILDASGFARHGTLSADYAAIWQTGTSPEAFLRFDGSNDDADLGNVLNMASNDFMVEVWLRAQGANGNQIDVLAKANNPFGTTSNTGLAVYRNTGNGITLRLNDGTNGASMPSANSTALQNVWVHAAFVADRDGNGQAYVNGVASGAPASLATIGSISNALSLRLGASSSLGERGQVDIGGVRVYDFGSGGLPSDIGTIISRHFTAERGYFGI
jgi:hypothetical protein